MEKLWIVRCNGGEFLQTFFENKVVALVWCADTDFKGKNKDAIKKELLKDYADCKKSIPAWTGFVNNFINEMSFGDYVLTYEPSLREYYLGKIIGDYEYNNQLKYDLHQTRAVEWYSDKPISRDFISTGTKNSLGSPQTLFRLTPEQKDEILKIFSGKVNKEVKEEHIEEENKEFSETLLDNAKESLKDAIQSLTPDEMEELLKEVLNAMGYIAKRSKKGADRGIDVFASTDGLGLEDPRIFVEVKHRKGPMSSQDIRQFIGGRQKNDKCLYVSTGGFTKDGKYEAERSSIALTLVDIEELANIISIYYDKFSVEGRTLLPLKKVYIPV